MHIYIYIYIYRYMHILYIIYIYMYLHIYISHIIDIYIHTYTHTYIYIFIYIHTHTHIYIYIGYLQNLIAPKWNILFSFVVKGCRFYLYSIGIHFPYIDNFGSSSYGDMTQHLLETQSSIPAFPAFCFAGCPSGNCDTRATPACGPA